MEDGLPLVSDGFEAALIGFAEPWQNGKKPVAIYDARKYIDILMEDMQCDYEEASEYFDFNVIGAYVGEQTPIFITIKDVDDLDDGGVK